MTPLDESRLDDPRQRAAIDRTDMLRALATAGAQVRRAGSVAREAGVADGRVTGGERPRAVHLAAVGASDGVAGLLQLVLGRTGAVPLSLGGSGPLPGWVGPLDLVVAVSLSGTAAGPLGQAREAARRGAHLLTVGAAGSPLAEAAADARGTHVPLDPTTVAGHSRTALWGLATPVLLAVADAGLATLPGGLLDRVADRLDAQAQACRPDADSVVNPAKSLAADLSEIVPLTLGDGEVTGVAARRASTMLARTARTPGAWGWLPDEAAPVLACLDGPMAGSGTAPDGGRDIFADPYLDEPGGTPVGLLLLRDPVPGLEADEAERSRHNRAQGVRERAAATGTRVIEQHAEPGHALERVAGLTALIDLASVYLGIGHGLDPAAPLPPLD